MMKLTARILAFGLFFLIIFINYECTRDKNSNNSASDSSIIKFSRYLNKFDSLELPIRFNMPTIYDRGFLNNEKIDSTNIIEYVSDYVNLWKYSNGSMELNYYYVGKLHEMENYYILIYAKIDNNTCCKPTPIAHDMKFVLSTYSKKDFKRISKIVIAALNECKYMITSYISKNLEIEIKYFFESNCKPVKIKDGFFLPNDKYPNYFVLEHYTASYKVLPDGKIACTKLTNLQKDIATYGTVDYDFPINIPEVDSL